MRSFTARKCSESQVSPLAAEISLEQNVVKVYEKLWTDQVRTHVHANAFVYRAVHASKLSLVCVCVCVCRCCMCFNSVEKLPLSQCRAQQCCHCSSYWLVETVLLSHRGRLGVNEAFQNISKLKYHTPGSWACVFTLLENPQFPQHKHWAVVF